MPLQRGMIVIRVDDGVLELLIDKTHPEFYRMGQVLGVSSVDLDTIFVTFCRAPLTGKVYNDKIEQARREAQEFDEQNELPF